MLRSLFTSATGMHAQQMNLDVIANNIANASTTGFKRNRAEFQDLIYQSLVDPGAQTGPGTIRPTGAQIGLGVSTGTTVPNFSQGTFIQGGEYDVAIKGNGFFRLQLPDGSTGYTRNGAFNIDNTGRLVNANGYPVQPDVIIPQNAGTVTVSDNGAVSVSLPGQPSQLVGNIQLSNFVNPAGLRSIGGSVYQTTPASGQPIDGAPGTQGLGTLNHRLIESSNVDIVEEMVRMIILQRAYDTNSKVIQAADEMLGTTNGIKR